MKLALLIFTIGLFTFQSVQASPIVLNHTSDLREKQLFEGFKSFYSRNNPNRSSSNTGLKLADTVVMFLAKYNGRTALYLLTDSKNDTAWRGKGAQRISK